MTVTRVRLVRACGSKLSPLNFNLTVQLGQARKSLWIETLVACCHLAANVGQARKSLWIETKFLGRR